MLLGTLALANVNLGIRCRVLLILKDSILRMGNVGKYRRRPPGAVSLAQWINAGNGHVPMFHLLGVSPSLPLGCTEASPLTGRRRRECSTNLHKPEGTVPLRTVMSTYGSGCKFSFCRKNLEKMAYNNDRGDWLNRI